ncbi:hypothetical protein FQN50_007412 [Emmonsiellopsis sp. PD_5]|nr:hypothetical protein FQN50_007412 [Emmonsiellopsis sp. PD_5]
MLGIAFPPQSCDEIPVLRIVQDGDVAFEVFLGNAKAKIHVLVSSQRMRMASSVFNDIFNSNFRYENLGVTRAFTGSGHHLVVSLPEDDAVALVTLCNIIHGKTNDIPKTPSVSELYSLAVLGHKYSCTEMLSVLMKSWMEEECTFLRHIDSGDLWMLLHVAYIQNNSYAFKSLSRQILLHNAGPTLDVPELAGHGLVHHKTLAAFQVKREKSLLLVHECLQSFLEELLKHGQKDEVLRYLDRLRVIGLFPLAKAYKDTPLSFLFEQLSCLDVINPSLNRRRVATRLSEIQAELGKIRDTELSLCLDCIKAEMDSTCENKCSGHDGKEDVPPTAPGNASTQPYNIFDYFEHPKTPSESALNVAEERESEGGSLI